MKIKVLVVWIVALIMLSCAQAYNSMTVEEQCQIWNKWSLNGVFGMCP